jgi:hypothetical protein
MGSVLDPCTQIRQKRWAERGDAFRMHPFGNDPEAYDPDDRPPILSFRACGRSYLPPSFGVLSELERECFELCGERA